MTLWLSDHVTLGDKLKNQYPLFREVYDHQTWKVGDLLWEEPNCGVTWSSDIVVMCGRVTNCKFNISSLEKPMTMKLGKLVTYRELNAPMKPYTLWPPGHLRSRDKLKKFFFSSRSLMATKLCKVLTLGDTKPIIKLHDSDHVIARGQESNWKLIPHLL